MSAALPPGPPYPAALQGVGFWTRPLGFLERCRARYGGRFTIRLPFAPPFVMLTDPDEVREVFQAPSDVLRPGAGARVLEPIVGRNSVILLDGAAHLEQRRLMLPAFHGERMTRLAGLVQEVTEAEIESWPGLADDARHPRLQRLTLEVILRAVFGLEPGPRLDGLRARLAEMLSFGDRPTSLLAPAPGSRADAILLRLPKVARFFAVQAEAGAMLRELIAERRAESAMFAARRTRNAGEAGTGPAGRDDVLAMLLAARHEDDTPMSDDELHDELLTLLVAGHETTASALAWALTQLARTPGALGALRAELDAGEDDAYLTAAIHETLRHRPVLPNVAPRLVAREIEIGGWRYPPGVCLVPNAYLIHHDAAIYRDPYAFRPERFLGRSPGTYTWIPFGGGRRRCLGASFALLEMKAVLRSLVTRYELAPVGAGEEPVRRRNITIRPGEGARIAITARRREAGVPAAPASRARLAANAAVAERA